MSDTLFTCQACGRLQVPVSADQRCGHCEAIFYLVWDWDGGTEQPTNDTYRAWAADTSGPITDRRTRKRFAAQWTRDDGTEYPVPRVAFDEVVPMAS